MTKVKVVHLAHFQHIYLLLIDRVLIFLQEAHTLILHLGTKDQVRLWSLTKSKS